MNNPVMPILAASNGGVNSLALDTENLATVSDLPEGVTSIDFLALLNSEISDLISDKALDEETLQSLDVSMLEEDFQNLNLVQNLDMTVLVGDFETTIDALKSLSKDWPSELQRALQQALDDLPEAITQLPFTSENMLFVQRQAVLVMAQKDIALAQKTQQLMGQDLSLDGKTLPIQLQQRGESSLGELKNSDIMQKTDEQRPNIASLVLNKADQDALKTSQKKASQQNIILTELKNEGETDSALADSVKKNDYIKSNDTVQKNMIDELSQNKINQDKQSYEQVIAKAHSEAAPQNRSVEQALIQNINNITGMTQASVTTPTASVVASSTMSLPLNPTPEQWGTALGDKVQWMVNSKLETAEIRIDPPHLGKMDVKIKMDGDIANIVIQTQQAATRDLVDAASFRLKEMLQDSGYNAVNVEISHREQGGAANEFAQSDSSDHQTWDENSKEIEDTETMERSIIAGTIHSAAQGLDLFA